MLTLVLQINRAYEYLNGGIRHDFLPGSLLNERYGILMLYWAVLKYSVIRLTRSIWLNTLRSQQQSCKLLALWKKAFGHSLFIKKRFMLDEKLKQNASKFVIFYIPIWQILKHFAATFRDSALMSLQHWYCVWDLVVG